MSKKVVSNKIIIAPLNWGWGHATRCIPIIKEIISLGLKPVIACDGSALVFLQKEFPNEEFIELPSYGIRYRQHFVWSMCLNIPRIMMAIVKEKNVIKNYIKNHKDQVVGIVSDNRLGIYHSIIPSVYMTHQLNIKAGVVSNFVNKLHHYFIRKHQECWVPDEVNSLFSGDLSKNTSNLNVKYIGVLSRFKKQQAPIEYDLLVLLSGVEGQRQALENVMYEQLKNYKGKTLLIRGSLKPCTLVFSKHVKVVDYMLSDELEMALNSSKKVIARSGYSTIMDLTVLEKQAFYIPTPGQTEQEYLAAYLKEKNVAVFSSQKAFKIELIDKKNVEESFKKTSQHCISEYLINAFKLSQG